MSQDMTVYDLGEIGSESKTSRARSSEFADQVAAPHSRRPDFRVRDPRPQPPGPSLAIPRTLAIFLPGSGQMLRGELSKGLFFVSSIGLLAALAWAIYHTLDRLGPTLGVLGFRPEGGVWALAALYGAAASLHLGSVFSAAQERGGQGVAAGLHPVAAGIASALIPGWGQLLKGHRLRAVGFLAGCWIVGAAWLLVTPPVQALLAEQNLFMPPALVWFCSPLVRWTAPAVIWTLAIYDATVSRSLRSAA